MDVAALDQDRALIWGHCLFALIAALIVWVLDEEDACPAVDVVHLSRQVDRAITDSLAGPAHSDLNYRIGHLQRSLRTLAIIRRIQEGPNFKSSR